MNVPMPFEFWLQGVPLSLQCANRAHLREWKDRIEQRARGVLQGGEWALEEPLYVTILYFPSAAMVGDVDNIVKPIIDAMVGPIMVNDRSVERVLVQKFEPGRVALNVDTAALAEAVDCEPPVVYVRVDNVLTKKDTMP